MYSPELVLWDMMQVLLQALVCDAVVVLCDKYEKHRVDVLG